MSPPNLRWFLLTSSHRFCTNEVWAVSLVVLIQTS
jgi:hypothetical protein